MQQLLKEIKCNWATKHLTSEGNELLKEAAILLNTSGVELGLLDSIVNYKLSKN